MPVDTEQLLRDKQIARARLWFVIDYEVVRFDVTQESIPELPTDGFLMGKALHVCGTGENIGGDGWLVCGMTPKGLLLQTTGGDKPDSDRYPGMQFSRCKLCPSALLHVAAEEMNQWQ